MICNKCNKENSDNNVVCEFCGNILIEVPDNKYFDKPKKEKKENKENKVSFFKQLENKFLKSFDKDIDDEEDSELDIDDEEDDDREV